MRVRFDEQLEKLNMMLIDMGALCEEAITYAVKALETGSDEMREKTFSTDEVIDEREREIETACLKLILQQQPVAKDLRVISSALKMISDMERIGDQAYDIAEITKTIENEAGSFCQEHISAMAQTAIRMVTVIISDDKVDDLFIHVKNDLIDAVTADRSHGEYLFDILMIAKYLERISDHAVNIAEWVIFSVTGKHVSEQQEKETI